MKKIKNFFLIIFSLVLIELFSQSIVLFLKNENYSFLLKPFFNFLEKKTKKYEIKWDYSKNKMAPGEYITNQNIEYIINSKGFRGKEFNLKKDRIRIIAFGGSTTVGLESPESKTYPAKLENLLNKTPIEKYEVINMGFSGKSLNFIKKLFFTEAYKYNPDIILILSNRNSIMYDGGGVDLNFENNKIVKINYFLQQNVMTYKLLLKIYKNFLNLTINSNYYLSPFGGKGVSKEYLLNGYKNSLIEIINFSKNKNIKVILIKQAYFFEPNIFLEINKLSIEDMLKKYENGFFKNKYKLSEEIIFWNVMGTIINKNLDDLEHYENVVIVDPVENLLKLKENFSDYIHLTPEGNKIIANEVFKKIIK